VPDRLLLLVDRVADGTGRPPLHRAFVAIEGERIAGRTRGISGRQGGVWSAR